MKNQRRLVVAVAIFTSTLAACQGGADEAGEIAPPDGSVAPDRPAPAISNPSSPTPVGTDVGSVQRDTSAGRVANDSMALPDQQPR